MLNLLSLFSGIGAPESALKRMEVPYNLLNYCEIDKYASKSYSMIHGESEEKNLVDVTKIKADDVKEPVDLLFYGFPCQDISLAGKQKGFVNEDGTLTRSGLFFSALNVIKMFKPKVAIAENVKNLTSKKFEGTFRTVLQSLDEAGYNNYYNVLNAKDYGVPQNRERIFIVSIRKDIDNGLFEFPRPFPLTRRLKDVLEKEVDEKYFIKKEINFVMKKNYIQWDSSGKGYESQNDRGYLKDGVSSAVTSANTSGNRCQVVLNEIGFIKKSENGTRHQSNAVFDDNGIARALTARDWKGAMMARLSDDE